MSHPAVVIFGGTAAYSLDPANFATVAETRTLETPYGRSPDLYKLITPAGTAVWFGSRHGENTLARSARFVNHQANLWAVRALEATVILSWNGVGAITPTLRVGELVIPTRLMDWTRHRINSFGPYSPHYPQAQTLRQAANTLDHINSGADATEAAQPFAPSAQEAIRQGAASLTPAETITMPAPAPTYVCTEGPRLETAAEIELAATLGADVVGMTLSPEVWLAAELGLKYASLCIVTNFATGRWHIDPRRDFGASVAARALTILLKTADLWPHVEASGS